MDATAEKFRFGDIVGYKPEKRKECFEYLDRLGYDFKEVNNETVMITSVPESEDAE